MICQDCKNGYHEGCPAGTWCDCQHRTPEIRRLDTAEAEAVYAQLMGGPVIEAKKAGVNFILQVPEGKDPEEFRKEIEAAMTPSPLPPEVADAIDRILAHPELLVRRERPQRKPLVELVTDGTYTTEAEVTRAALVELTQLAQEMGLE